MIKLSDKQILELFDQYDKSLYSKYGDFVFRNARTDETVLTIVAGRLETIKKANKEDVVIRNLNIGGFAETYIISKETFDKRYEIVDKESLYIDGFTYYWCKPKGQVYAFEYIGDPFIFIAPWGEEMICDNGDYIANPVGGSKADIYRIERETFFKTYK